MSDEPVLAVRDLHVRFGTKQGTAHVVRGLDYDLHAGETLALVGESGSGKSVSTLALTGLLPQPPARIAGEVLLRGEDLLSMDDDQLRGVRGTRVGYVFQDPMTSLNPVLPIGRQLTDGMLHHLDLSPQDAHDRAGELLDLVGIPDARRRLDDYPHQFSGGMRQRVVIAIGLACDPEVLVADEPTTALDVTTQAQLIGLVDRLQDELGMAVVWITHDLGVVAGIADRVLVMYAGQVVEQAAVDDLFEEPMHPYTVGLLGSLPIMGTDEPGDLTTIPGLPPDPTRMPEGCGFHPRCGLRLDERCATQMPPLREVRPGHLVRSFYEVPAEDRAHLADAHDGPVPPGASGAVADATDHTGTAARAGGDT